MEFGIYKVLKNTELEFEYMEFGIWNLGFRNMEDNTNILLYEEGITKLIKKIFEDEFKKQVQNLAKIISGNLEITSKKSLFKFKK